MDLAKGKKGVKCRVGVVPWGECKVLPFEELEKLQWLKTDGRKA